MDRPAAADAPWLRWRHQAVRDLAWALASPPLLAPADNDILWLDDDWCRQTLAASSDWLARLDHDPTPLLTALAGRDQRLGSYFEGLLAFWLASPANTRYRLIAQNLPVRAQRLTLGELDFLVEDRQLGEIQHWEVAVKFYLGVPARDQRRNQELDWIGPGLHDRLERKRAHLTGQQLGLTRTPAGMALMQQLHLPPARPVCLLKGALFYPAGHQRPPQDAGHDHPGGWWLPVTDFLADPAHHTLSWLPLPKRNWLTAVTAPEDLGQAVSAEQLSALLISETSHRAMAVIGIRDGREVTRGFVAPAGWPHQA